MEIYIVSCKLDFCQGVKNYKKKLIFCIKAFKKNYFFSLPAGSLNSMLQSGFYEFVFY